MNEPILPIPEEGEEYIAEFAKDLFRLLEPIERDHERLEQK